MLRMILSAVALGAVLAAGSADAQTRTCTGRDQLCRNECIKNFRTSAGCNQVCDTRKRDCMSTGCWGNAADSRCGFQKS